VDSVKLSIFNWLHTQSDRLSGDVVAAFEHLFATAQQELKAAFLLHIPGCAGRGGYLVNRSTGELVRGGTTMTVGALVHGKIYTANVGDSLAVVVSEAVGTIANLRTGEMRAATQRVELVCADHAPSNLNEMERLKSTLLVPLYEQLTASKGTPIESGVKGHYHKNVRREWATVVSTQGGPFSETLSMTRSLGDFYLHTLGLSHKPDVFEYNPKGRFAVLIATDGVWDNFCFEEIGDLIDFEKTDGANMSALIQENSVRATRNFGESRDNATAILFQPALKTA
jgi:serine/threonine protein phosphatase PrpC